MSQFVTKKRASFNATPAAALDGPANATLEASDICPSVFMYQDYRLYLKAVFQYRRQSHTQSKKPSHKKYNLKSFAKALGFSSHAGLAMILTGKRELRPPYLDRCLEFLALNMNERLYFEAMLRAGGLSEAKRRALLREVKFLSQSWEPPPLEEGIRLLDYGLVHQILCLHHRFVSVAEIQARFRYPISPQKISEILHFMLERGQVLYRTGAGGDTKSSAGEFKIQTDVLLTKDEVPSAPAQQMHRDCLNLAALALSDALDKREFQSYIFTMNSKQLESMKLKIKQTVREAVSEFENTLDADTVVQLHFNMFEAIQKSPSQEDT